MVSQTARANSSWGSVWVSKTASGRASALDREFRVRTDGSKTRRTPALYRHSMTMTRRTVLTAISAAAGAQAQRPRVPNWKPKLGVLCAFSDANLEFVKAEG